jgi:hypothetical protein
VNQDGGIILAKDGKAQIRFRSNGSKRLLFKPVLKSFEPAHEDLTGSICHYQTVNNEVVFLTKLPSQGKYRLDVFAKDIESDSNAQNGSKTERTRNRGQQKAGERGALTERPSKPVNEDPSFEHICSYLIKSDCGFFDLAPYPPLDNDYVQTGDLTPFVDTKRGKKSSSANAADPRLTSQSHPEAVIDPYDKGQLNVKLTADREAELKARMTRYYQQDGDEEDVSEYVYMQRNKRDVDVLAQFPKIGFYKLSLTTGDERIVHQYLINAVNPDVKCSAFARPGEAWRNGFELIQPRSGLLEANKKVAFKMRVPGARRVHADWKNGQTKQELTSNKKEPDLWEGEVQTDPQGGDDLRIFADGDDLLLTYKVQISLHVDVSIAFLRL